MSLRTEQAYLAWIRRYIRYHGLKHPLDLGEAHIVDYLTHIAERGAVAQSTQMQALSALLFLYREVLGRPVGDLRAFVRARAPTRLPVVLSRDEARTFLSTLSGDMHLVALLLYGSGLRLQEALSLRVKDVDFERREILVRRGKGARDRVTMLPVRAIEPLRRKFAFVQRLHARDLGRGAGRVELPDALERKAPAWASELGWQWVFPARRLYRDVTSGELRRHHLHETAVQRAVRRGVQEAGIAKRATCHSLRHSLRRIFWRMATIFVRFRSCWVIQM